MSLFSFFRNRKLKREEQKRLLELDDQMKKKRLLSEITRAKLAASTLEQKMERKLTVSCNKAISARQNDEKALMKNAYIDIKMALYYKKVAAGLMSAMERLESNLQFVNIAESMSHTLEKASELTSANPTIDVSKISLLYEKVMDPLSSIVDKISDFGDMAADVGIDGFDISDEEVENLLQSVAANGKASAKDINRIKTPADYDPKSDSDWANDTGEYIDNLFKQFGFKK